MWPSVLTENETLHLWKIGLMWTMKYQTSLGAASASGLSIYNGKQSG